MGLVSFSSCLPWARYWARVSQLANPTHVSKLYALITPAATWARYFLITTIDNWCFQTVGNDSCCYSWWILNYLTALCKLRQFLKVEWLDRNITVPPGSTFLANVRTCLLNFMGSYLRRQQCKYAGIWAGRGPVCFSLCCIWDYDEYRLLGFDDVCDRVRRFGGTCFLRLWGRSTNLGRKQILHPWICWFHVWFTLPPWKCRNGG
jgi:hypothetical protein